MSNSFLDYSSWLFQLIAVLGILYLVVGLVQPSWVLAKSRATVTVVGVAVVLIAATVFYYAMVPLEESAVLPGASQTPPATMSDAAPEATSPESEAAAPATSETTTAP